VVIQWQGDNAKKKSLLVKKYVLLLLQTILDAHYHQMERFNLAQKRDVHLKIHFKKRAEKASSLLTPSYRFICTGLLKMIVGF